MIRPVSVLQLRGRTTPRPSARRSERLAFRVFPFSPRSACFICFISSILVSFVLLSHFWSNLVYSCFIQEFFFLFWAKSRIHAIFFKRAVRLLPTEPSLWRIVSTALQRKSADWSSTANIFPSRGRRFCQCLQTKQNCSSRSVERLSSVGRDLEKEADPAFSWGGDLISKIFHMDGQKSSKSR